MGLFVVLLEQYALKNPVLNQNPQAMITWLFKYFAAKM